MSEKKVDWGKATTDALNRATNTPEFNRSYLAWLERIGPKHWTPVARADYEQMKAEEAGAKQRDLEKK